MQLLTLGMEHWDLLCVSLIYQELRQILKKRRGSKLRVAYLK